MLKTLASTCKFAEQENGLIRDRIVLGIKKTVGYKNDSCEKITLQTWKKAIEIVQAAEASGNKSKNMKYDTATINFVKENQNKPKTQYNCKSGDENTSLESVQRSGKFVLSAKRKPFAAKCFQMVTDGYIL
ncbi:hypothetical protein TNCV_5001871 [Trichonephila clavipes]|nr:hypothetical protein TNCV_5001871 [Trichonephila clavipes]